MIKTGALWWAVIFFISQIGLAGPKTNAQKGGVNKPGTTARSAMGEAFSPENFRPDTQVPPNPERFIWKLSTKRSTLVRGQSDVPVYAFDAKDGRDGRYTVGTTQVGEPVTLDEFRVSGRRNFYRYQWQGRAKGPALGSNTAFWVDGINIEYAGKK